MTVPRIPDDAFMHALERVARITSLVPVNAADHEVQEAADNFWRALGLDGGDRSIAGTTAPSFGP